MFVTLRCSQFSCSWDFGVCTAKGDSRMGNSRAGNSIKRNLIKRNSFFKHATYYH